jgi:hypothetical protein
MNKKQRTLALSSFSAYALLKQTKHQVDPYTRCILANAIGFSLAFQHNATLKLAGIGLMIGGALQLMETRQGGRIIRNESDVDIYILDESGGVFPLKPKTIPKQPIDGFTMKGWNGVFKVSDGVYINILKDKRVAYAAGFGKLINQQVRNAGFKHHTWVQQQADARWEALYAFSV